ncbi:hypothetical protein [Litorimonas haliclonae]|uniref:hypothetical protein n=1 Tax=Litorimonas haliclonae TaxID=2081977 RepID=UPI0039EFB9FE
MLTLYSCLVFFHILLFVFWLGGDLGVAILGDNFRKKDTYSVQERLTILKLLVLNDLGPRYAWALMIASTISLVTVGGYWAVPAWGVILAWVISFFWLWLVLSAHKAGQTEKGTKLRKIEVILKWVLAAFYLGLGSLSLTTNAPLEPNWLASKALLFGLIFVAAILIDVMFKPVGPLLMALIEKGSSDETEVPLLRTMNKSRFWVRMTYLLLVITAFIGTTKFF